MWVSYLPTVNATLNGLSAVLLITGVFFIRRKQREIHKRFMLAACATSTLFLISYLFYHSIAGSTKYQGEGILRPIYFSILISHTILAATIVPLAIVTLIRGLKSRFEAHARIARWTFPIWVYVSVTGVVIYLMLYQF